MKKDDIFFSKDNNGLTVTSANYLANLAKESYQRIEQELTNICFYNKEVELLSSDTKKTLRKGLTTTATFESSLMEMASLKSLIAWLREAIKAKDRLISEAKGLKPEEVAKTLGLTIPERPSREEYLTEDDYLASLNIKQRNQYYHLQTQAAVIGAFIHPRETNSMAKAREGMMRIIQSPCSISGSGRDAIITTCTPSLPIQEVEETFMALQAKHREIQAQLNAMKHEMELALQEDQRTKDAAYTMAAQKYNAEVDIINAKIAEYTKQKIFEAQALKIVIPDSLKEIYNRVSSLGKKK